ncbi:MAG: hypothetical protein AAF701_08270, partial [Pseudomonadota bacterium]
NASLNLEDDDFAGLLGFDNGWWGPEQKGRWIGQSLAHMEFMLPVTDGGLSLDLTFDVFSPNARDIRVLFDGTVLYDGEIGTDGVLNLDVSALPRQTLVQLRFVFDTPVFDCPANRFQANDSRQLAAMLWNIGLYEQNQVPSQNLDTADNGQFIANAAGPIGTLRRTNSLDALWENHDTYDFFEVDLSFTFDGQLVCLQDWDQAFTQRFGFDALEVLSHRTFIELLNKVELPGPTNCTMHTLAGWLYQNNTKRVVTDFANNDIASLTELAATLPSLKERFIVELKDPAAVQTAIDLGFVDIVLDLSASDLALSDITRGNTTQGAYAVKLNPDQIRKGWAQTLKAISNLRVYAGVVNDATQAQCMLDMGADALFTDTLAMADLDGVATTSDTCGVM